ncbi:DHS-like NAD/FAD-binding domain-containing protein, partial [Tribonema minus]
MLAGDDEEGCGDGDDDDDDDSGARPRRADTGGEDLNDVDADADGNDSGTRGADALTDSGRAAGRGGSTFGARTNARAWRILQSLMMWRNKCLVAEKRVTRPKLTSINTLEDVAALLTRARNVIVLTGAGISVACGIPDFRSENGLYSMLGEYQLPSPQAMFDIAYFRTNPAPFFKFARELLPGSYTPSATHRFIKALQDRGKLLRNYTQNIDGLEREAGVLPEHLHQCHGSLDTARCLRCEHRVPVSDIEAEIRAQTIPMCKICNHPDGVVKPDIVFFGEPLGRRFMDLLTADRARCDAVLVMGSSLKVAPVNLIIGWMPRDVPLVLLNRETVGQPHAFDVELLGDCDAAVAALTRLLGWPADAG